MAWPASCQAMTFFSWSVMIFRDSRPATTRSSASSKSAWTMNSRLVAAGEDRGLVREVREVGAGEARAVARDPLEAHVLAQRLVGRVDLQDLDPSLAVGRRHEHLAVEAAGAKQRLVELLQEVRRGHDDHVVLRVEAVHLDQELVERLVALAGDVGAALRSNGVELVDEDDRGGGLARLLEEAADARGAEAGEHLDERGGGLGEEGRAGLVRDCLRQERLAGAGWPVEEDSLRAPSRRGCLNRFGSERKSTISRSSSFVSSTPATSSNVTVCFDLELISCGFVRGISLSVFHMK